MSRVLSEKYMCERQSRKILVILSILGEKMEQNQREMALHIFNYVYYSFLWFLVTPRKENSRGQKTMKKSGEESATLPFLERN